MRAAASMNSPNTTARIAVDSALPSVGSQVDGLGSGDGSTIRRRDRRQAR